MVDKNLAESLSCIVCLEPPKDPFESSCCHQLFCGNCCKSFQQKECPGCRAPNPTFQLNHFVRRMIGELPTVCPFDCGTKTTIGELDSHLSRCPKRKLQCVISNCNFEGTKDMMRTHLSTNHFDEVWTALTQKPKVENQAGFQDLHKSYINSSGKKAVRGETGKFYCGQKTDVPCTCCDGNCGPTNGCNCTPCMMLDVKVNNLPPGYILNLAGYPAKISTETGGFYCGRRLVLKPKNGWDGVCGPNNGPQCPMCNRLQKRVQFYKDFLVKVSQQQA
eukprot:TRINITY_DN13446_c0_g1_i1.p1 TRINITY_DN13446_c0_g1~~TRINITY_DN13446_c0_g1_i1.p1  ORF type:complete len:276 (+),score=8.42 TRINITY_DN13446_c0_g1_i1:104-931(+)